MCFVFAEMSTVERATRRCSCSHAQRCCELESRCAELERALASAEARITAALHALHRTADVSAPAPSCDARVSRKRLPVAGKRLPSVPVVAESGSGSESGTDAGTDSEPAPETPTDCRDHESADDAPVPCAYSYERVEPVGGLCWHVRRIDGTWRRCRARLCDGKSFCYNCKRRLLTRAMQSPDTMDWFLHEYGGPLPTQQLK